MTESLDPLAATAEIETAYRRYLRSTMRTNDPKLDAAIAAAFDGMKRPLVQGPILESSPPFRAGRPVSALVEAGLLSPDWLRHDFQGQVVVDRPLYLHQDEAITRVVEERRNVVVATGTGSGKTEAFLVPIIETLFRQQATGRLRPGVRALLLYPMNALANDQLRRLRGLLRDVPAITFGRYTGETQETRQRGIAALEAAASNVTILSNELLGREEMQATPPHILLTNYAMLEYLLLRPDDSPLFDPTGEDGWKFIVLDGRCTPTTARWVSRWGCSCADCSTGSDAGRAASSASSRRQRLAGRATALPLHGSLLRSLASHSDGTTVTAASRMSWSRPVNYTRYRCPVRTRTWMPSLVAAKRQSCRLPPWPRMRAFSVS